MSDFSLMMIKEFLGDNWEMFKHFCEERNIDPDEMYESIESDESVD